MTSSIPILYSFRRCPYAIRARMTLHYSKILLEHREVKLSNKPDTLLKISPKGTVPVLQLKDKSVLDESLDIMQWALSKFDPDDWGLNEQKYLQAEAFRLIKSNDELFKPQLDHYKYSDRFPEQNMEYYRQNCEQYLKGYEAELSKHTFLLGEKISIADIAIFPFIRQCAFVDKEWFDQLPYNHLQHWLVSFLNNDLFTSIMDKHPVWNEPEVNI